MNGRPRLFGNTGIAAAALVAVAACADDPARHGAPLGVTALLSAAGTPGMVGQYAFNEGTGTIAHDGSGAGAHATLFGAGWSTNSPLGGAGNFSLDLSGNVPHYSVPATRWAEIPEASLALSTTAITLAAWVTAPGDGVLQVIIGKQLNGYYRDAFVLHRSGNQWVFQVDGNTTGGAGIGVAGPTPTSWTHVAGTYDGATLRLYVNGVLAASTPATVVMSFTGEPVTIGADYDIFGTKAGGGVPDGGWSGLIDDVEIHNRALSDAEIAYLASLTPPEPPPPPPPPPANNPETKDDCKNGGWRNYGFRNQGQCVRFVETGQDSRAQS